MHLKKVKADSGKKIETSEKPKLLSLDLVFLRCPSLLDRRLKMKAMQT